MTRTYQTEFPDFDPVTMPNMPEGFEDDSWHNDVCPSFYNEALKLKLWVDQLDPELSEYGEARRDGSMKRFVLVRDDPESWVDGEELAQADHFVDILAAIEKASR